jgi:hypothetical protein
MITESEAVFCIECKTPIEQCFCFCPYCGEQKNNCFCNIDTEVLSTKNYSKPDLPKPSFHNTRDDFWWRLEKWQVGRRNFP